MKVYISGPITGLKEEDFLRNFKQAEELLKSLGLDPVNPCEIEGTKDCKTWEEFMLCDIRELFKCDAIYMIDGWITSRGARIERAIAVEMDKKVFYFKDFVNAAAE